MTRRVADYLRASYESTTLRLPKVRVFVGFNTGRDVTPSNIVLALAQNHGHDDELVRVDQARLRQLGDDGAAAEDG